MLTKKHPMKCHCSVDAVGRTPGVGFSLALG
jgi:hypothetical protein